MTPTGITIIASIIAGALLTVTGTYFTVNNLINPQGFLFEGIVMLSLGVMTFLLVAIAGALGKTMITFGDILKQQDAIFKQQIKDAVSPAGGTGFGDFLNNMMKNPSANKITLDLINPDMLGGIPIKQFEGLEGMELEELEQELSNAIKTDDYEKAEEINKAIKELKNFGGEPGEESEDNM